MLCSSVLVEQLKVICSAYSILTLKQLYVVFIINSRERTGHPRERERTSNLRAGERTSNSSAGERTSYTRARERTSHLRERE